jgi:hypothetical protein
MRTYEIIDTASGAVLSTQTMDDSLAPVLRDGHEHRLTHIDGEPVIEGEPLKLTDEERAALPPLGEIATVEDAAPAVGEHLPHPEIVADPITGSTTAPPEPAEHE